MRGTKVVQGRVAVRCPYPDCQGEVLEGEPFCAECGRSLAPTAVAAAKAGMATRGDLPGASPGLVHPAYRSLPLSPAAAPEVPLSAPSTPRSGDAMAPATLSPVPWLVGGLLGLFLLSVLVVLGLIALSDARTRTPVPTPTPRTLMLTMLVPALPLVGDFALVPAWRTPDGARLGLLSLPAGYSDARQGAPDVIGQRGARANGARALRLAASAQPVYAQRNLSYRPELAARQGSARSQCSETIV